MPYLISNDGKHLFLAIRVTDKADVEPPETSWIEEVTERSVGANQSPFTPKKKPTQPAQINIRQIAPENIVGFATVEQVYKHVDAFLRCIAVNKKAQRLGVGGYLLKFLTDTYGPTAGQYPFNRRDVLQICTCEITYSSASVWDRY